MRSEQMRSESHAIGLTSRACSRKINAMDAVIERLPDDVAELKRLIAQHESTIQRHLDRLETKQTYIERLEEQLRRMQQHRFGKRSEKDLNQGELHWFNEAELLAAMQAAQAPVCGADENDAQGEFCEVAGHQRKKQRSHGLPADLPRTDVIHDLSEEEKVCDCGQTLQRIGEDVSEQLSVIPQQFYVIVHHRLKYACACKACIRTAAMPPAPLPGSQASPQLLAYSIVAKLHDGLPLYRQEAMARREQLELPRAKLARWHIGTGLATQPLYNLIQDAFFDYDIAQSDDTGIQVLKEAGRAPENKSYLWIRRGGPPDKPVVLLDYSPSKSGETAYGLLSEFRGYLVCDAATNFNLSVKKNGLVPVLCNDHARRKLVEAIRGLPSKDRVKAWAAAKGVAFYKLLYRIERDIADYSPVMKVQHRHERAVPVWDEFIGWAKTIVQEGLAHGSSREALKYLLKHEQGLRRYCEDGRLPISNILAEHVAKKVAIARKNFLFADTPAGAKSTAMNYCLIETARANGHNAFQYLAVVLAALPSAASLGDYEALLPWNVTPDEIRRRYNGLPAP